MVLVVFVWGGCDNGLSAFASATLAHLGTHRSELLSLTLQAQLTILRSRITGHGFGS